MIIKSTWCVARVMLVLWRQRCSCDVAVLCVRQTSCDSATGNAPKWRRSWWWSISRLNLLSGPTAGSQFLGSQCFGSNLNIHSSTEPNTDWNMFDTSRRQRFATQNWKRSLQEWSNHSDALRIFCANPRIDLLVIAPDRCWVPHVSVLSYMLLSQSRTAELWSAWSRQL